MQLKLTEKERDYLKELLQSNHDELLHELHHTDTNEYKEILLIKVALVESLQSKLK